MEKVLKVVGYLLFTHFFPDSFDFQGYDMIHITANLK